MEDLRTPEGIAKAKRTAAAQKRKDAQRQKRLAEAIQSAAGQWQPIETCPFDALHDAWDMDGLIWVSDGQDIALARVSRRYGRPVKMIEPARMALTDDGFAWVGGKFEEYDRPSWWFQWELANQLETTIAYGDTVQREVDFVPTHWKPAKPELPAGA